MPETEQTRRRAANIELARQFYQRHRLAFAQAEKPQGTADKPIPPSKQFAFSAEQFDEWAVGAGFMSKRLSDASELEQGGVLYERLRLRVRLNRASRRGDGIERAYSIEARAKHWRVVLLERFVVEQPKAIVSAIGRCLVRSDRTAEQTYRWLDAQAGLSDEERLLCRVRLEMAQLSILSGARLMQAVVIGLDTSKTPDMRQIRRRMAEALLWDPPAKGKKHNNGRQPKRRASRKQVR